MRNGAEPIVLNSVIATCVRSSANTAKNELSTFDPTTDLRQMTHVGHSGLGSGFLKAAIRRHCRSVGVARHSGRSAVTGP
jgi:hypothetical protein